MLLLKNVGVNCRVGIAMFNRLVRKAINKIDTTRFSKKDYLNNAERITEANEKMFFSAVYIMTVLYGALFIAGMFVEGLSANRNLYVTGILFAVLLVVIEKVILSGYSLWLSYVLGIGYFLIGLKFNIAYPNYMATVLISVFLIIPLIITDISWRVDGFITIMCVISAVVSIMIKDKSIAEIDVTNFICFAIVGIYLGEILKSIRLKHFNNLLKLSEQRYTDQLTGMFNRRKLFQDLIENTSESNFIGAIMIDIDWFKKLNDTYGHEIGDDCLKRIGKCFVKYGNSNDIKFYRYGGEEFIAISNVHSSFKLREISNELLKIVRSLEIPAEYSPYGVVTVSIGFSEGLIRSIKECENLINQADKALYRAKTISRNTCVGYNASKFI